VVGRLVALPVARFWRGARPEPPGDVRVMAVSWALPVAPFWRQDLASAVTRQPIVCGESG
jgi:hypothetical protein